MLWFAKKSLIITILLFGLSHDLQARDAVIGYSGRTIAGMPFAWASRKGFFKEANLEVKWYPETVTAMAEIANNNQISKDTDRPGRFARVER